MDLVSEGETGLFYDIQTTIFQLVEEGYQHEFLMAAEERRKTSKSIAGN